LIIDSSSYTQGLRRSTWSTASITLARDKNNDVLPQIYGVYATTGATSHGRTFALAEGPFLEKPDPGPVANETLA